MEIWVVLGLMASLAVPYLVWLVRKGSQMPTHIDWSRRPNGRWYSGAARRWEDDDDYFDRFGEYPHGHEAVCAHAEPHNRRTRGKSRES